jgi:hypothetical protein
MLDFTEMKLTCLGAVESLEITGAGTVTKEFDFWDCLFTPYTASFVSTSTCDPGAGTTFVLGFGAYASHVEDEIVGALGIEADGTFLTPTEHTALAPDGDVPTRVRLPGSVQIIGSTGETYEFFPAQQAYLNESLWFHRRAILPGHAGASAHTLRGGGQHFRAPHHGWLAHAGLAGGLAGPVHGHDV